MVMAPYYPAQRQLERPAPRRGRRQNVLLFYAIVELTGHRRPAARRTSGRPIAGFVGGIHDEIAAAREISHPPAALFYLQNSRRDFGLRYLELHCLNHLSKVVHRQ
jgi:hypothetical protein